MDPIKIALMGGGLSATLRKAKPKPKPAPKAGPKKPDVPLPGFPVRRGLDEPTIWGGGGKA